jgi:tetratricopeptide (TPR) repeat protein
MSRPTRVGHALLALACLLASCAPDRGSAYTKSVADAQRAYHHGRFGEAAARWDEAAKNAKLARDAVYARYEAALARARAGDVARAATELRAIANASPPNAYSAQAAFKVAELARANDVEAGVRELEDVVVRFPESGVAKVAVLRIARHDDEKGGAAGAIAHLDRMRSRVSGKAVEETILYERAKRLAALGQKEAARDAFLDVAQRWPYPFGAYFDDSLYRAAEIDESLGRYREAIAHLERLLSFRETASFMGSYERPKYVPAILRIAEIHETKLHDLGAAREALHRLYADFKTSPLRDDALWREAELWRKEGDADKACGALSTLASDFPDSKYVPCATARCPSISRSSKSKAPKECHPYLLREDARTAPELDPAKTGVGGEETPTERAP